MKYKHAGFTMIELVVVILIGSILTGIAFSSFSSVMGGYSVRGARDTFAVMHARARARAIEAGSNIHLFVSASGDSIVIRNGTTIVDMVDFDTELDVNIVMATDSMRTLGVTRTTSATASVRPTRSGSFRTPTLRALSFSPSANSCTDHDDPNEGL